MAACSARCSPRLSSTRRNRRSSACTPRASGRSRRTARSSSGRSTTSRSRTITESSTAARRCCRWWRSRRHSRIRRGCCWICSLQPLEGAVFFTYREKKMSLQARRNFWPLLLVAALAAFASGCATVKDAPLKENAASVDVTGEALVFMTARLTNAYKPRYTPTILVTFIQSATGEMETFSFRADKAYSTGDGYSEHIVAFKLAPGRYQVRQIRAMSRAFPIIALFEVPVYQMIDVKKPGAYYLGRIEATVVERTDEKLLRAGPVVPLIDQGVAG